MYLMDVNVFIYAYREDVAQHLEYREWLESVLNSQSFYGVSELVLSGFLRNQKGQTRLKVKIAQ